MSVLSLEHPEEFPELVEICQKAFVHSAKEKALPEIKPRTIPTFDIVTMEDGELAPPTALIAAREFAEVAMMKPEIPRCTSPANVAIPNENYYTMEDGGQSEGASATSARAAQLLAHLDDAAQIGPPAPAKQRIPDHRPCNGSPAYCC